MDFKIMQLNEALDGLSQIFNSMDQVVIDFQIILSDEVKGYVVELIWDDDIGEWLVKAMRRKEK